MATTIPVSVALSESGPNRLVLHDNIPVHCEHTDGGEVAAVLSVDLIAAYACGEAKMEVTAKLATAASALAKDPAFWAAVEPHVKRAWEQAQGA